MTVCIAAFCEKLATIVAASDKMLGNVFSEADTPLVKLQNIHRNWRVMFSGDDISPVVDILCSATAAMMKTDSPTAEEARAIVAQSFIDVRLKRFESQYLVSRGFTLEKFMTEGKTLLPTQTFEKLHDRLSQFDLGIDLLVVGHKDNVGHIFSVVNPGADDSYTVPGFHAIGVGSTNALSCLAQRGLNPLESLTKTLYYVFEAKQYAEKTGGVGKTTDMSILRDGKNYKLSDQDLKELEAVWEQVKLRDVDESMLEKILVRKLAL